MLRTAQPRDKRTFRGIAKHTLGLNLTWHTVPVECPLSMVHEAGRWYAWYKDTEVPVWNQPGSNKRSLVTPPLTSHGPAVRPASVPQGDKEAVSDR